MVDLQKASLVKRIGALLVDLVFFALLVYGGLNLFGRAVNYSTYTKQMDEKADSYSQSKLQADTQKWQQQSEVDRYAALARLIQSVYNKSTIGVNINTIMDLLGM